MKPHINREKLNTVKVRAGQIVKLDVDIKGEPPPTVTWSFQNKQLETSASVSIHNEDYNTKFALSNTVRKMTGKYTIKAVNTSGEDEADVEIIILGKDISFFLIFQSLSQSYNIFNIFMKDCICKKDCFFFLFFFSLLNVIFFP